MAKKYRRTRPRQESSTSTVVAIMAPLIYVVTSATIHLLR